MLAFSGCGGSSTGGMSKMLWPPLVTLKSARFVDESLLTCGSNLVHSEMEAMHGRKLVADDDVYIKLLSG